MLDSLVREARGWLADCGCSTRGMDATRVIRTVHWNYEGGWQEFVLADPEASPGAVQAAMAERYGQAFAAEMGRR
jgi:hypothetical protein